MPHLRTILRKLSPDAAQQSFRRARPGSVLILVVALLVLMALIGTAWMSTTKIDRYSAQQNSYNVQIDMLVQGAVNLVEAVVGDDLFEEGAYRKAPNWAVPTVAPHRLPVSRPRLDPPVQPPGPYEHFESPLRDYWLG